MARSGSGSANSRLGQPAKVCIELAMGACMEAIRLSRAISIEGLARHTGIPANLLDDYEAGTRRAQAADVVKLAMALDVPVSALFAIALGGGLEPTLRGTL